MRLHPILHYSRAHRGVDYAAPIGTRVLASSDGTVGFVGQQSGYGNVVVIEHRDSVSTLYAHLSAFASGLSKGQHVEQGETIGYVGMTGLATGPHLHYEFRVNGEHQDPVNATTALGIPLSDRLQASFAEKSRPLAERLEVLRGTNLARFE
jgi:murein DD-endopeptidase MepM/ murein hydrolase activator NlpD